MRRVLFEQDGRRTDPRGARGVREVGPRDRTHGVTETNPESEDVGWRC